MEQLINWTRSTALTVENATLNPLVSCKAVLVEFRLLPKGLAAVVLQAPKQLCQQVETAHEKMFNEKVFLFLTFHLSVVSETTERVYFRVKRRKKPIPVTKNSILLKKMFNARKCSAFRRTASSGMSHSGWQPFGKTSNIFLYWHYHWLKNVQVKHTIK